ncbi:MAG: hypothetical protein LBF97_05395, partial [Elusimicrobiota bacterium]|nr:hypothetical protein [Elusimicrobiota bacterium]
MENNEKCFCIPLAGGLNYVKKIVNKFKNKIYEFYGTNGEIISAVNSKNINIDEFYKIIDFLNYNNIKFNFTMNNMNGYVYSENDKYKKILKI